MFASSVLSNECYNILQTVSVFQGPQCSELFVSEDCHSRLQVHVFVITHQGLKWVGTHGSAVPRPTISAIWRFQASKSVFFMGTHVPRPERI